VLILAGLSENKRSVARIVGILIKQTETGILISGTAAGRPAEIAGLLAGDRLTSINGSPVENLAEYDKHARAFTPKPVEFGILRGTENLVFEVIPGVEFQRTKFLTTTLTVLAYLALALVVLFKGSKDRSARLLMIFSAAVAVELAIPGLAFAPVTLAALGGAAFLLLSGFQMAVELHLASVIPKKQSWITRRPWVIPSYYVLGLGFGLVGGSIFAADTFGSSISPWNSSDVSWFLGNLMLPFWAVAVPLLLVHQALRFPDPTGRHQAGLVLVGVLPWTVFTLASLVFPTVLNQAAWYFGPLQSVVLLMYPVAVFFAIFRYHLFDIELVVRRGLVYSLLTAILVLLFFTFVGVGGTMMSAVVGETFTVWLASGATLVLGLLFSPLREAAKKTIDRRFFPERYAIRRRLITLSEELPSLGNLPKMGQYLAEQLRSIFAVRSVTLLIGDHKTGILTTLASTEFDLETRLERSVFVSPDDAAIQALVDVGRPTKVKTLLEVGSTLTRHMDALETTLAVPMTTHGDLIGVILLGKRDAGDRFPAEELDLLSLLAHHLATTFENARLFESATFEGLTGLLRREPILERLKSEIARAERYHRSLTIGLVDLDHFKLVNDTFGHLTGDGVLKRVAKTISEGLRDSDQIGRYGGDEFLFVLAETNCENAIGVAGKIRDSVDDLQILAEDGRKVRVTISIGLASIEQMTPGHTPTVDDLLSLADKNLYAAKQQGRNRVAAGAL
jgi:diguanylate cyclase (GGDEF)-like protein